ncbi:3-ketoacyl-CoA thiolase 2, peroxisomal [Tanacetum coccineum]
MVTSAEFRKTRRTHTTAVYNRQTSKAQGEDHGTSSRFSSSNGGYVRKCFIALWRNEEGTRSGCGELNRTILDRKAAVATASVLFGEKIVDPKTGKETPVRISVDDGIRPGTTLADLAKLKPIFKKDGSTTAGT